MYHYRGWDIPSVEEVIKTTEGIPDGAPAYTVINITHSDPEYAKGEYGTSLISIGWALEELEDEFGAVLSQNHDFSGCKYRSDVLLTVDSAIVALAMNTVRQLEKSAQYRKDHNENR